MASQLVPLLAHLQQVEDLRVRGWRMHLEGDAGEQEAMVQVAHHLLGMDRPCHPVTNIEGILYQYLLQVRQALHSRQVVHHHHPIQLMSLHHCQAMNIDPCLPYLPLSQSVTCVERTQLQTRNKRQSCISSSDQPLVRVEIHLLLPLRVLFLHYRGSARPQSHRQRTNLSPNPHILSPLQRPSQHPHLPPPRLVC